MVGGNSQLTSQLLAYGCSAWRECIERSDVDGKEATDKLPVVYAVVPIVVFVGISHGHEDIDLGEQSWQDQRLRGPRRQTARRAQLGIGNHRERHPIGSRPPHRPTLNALRITVNN